MELKIVTLDHPKSLVLSENQGFEEEKPYQKELRMGRIGGFVAGTLWSILIGALVIGTYLVRADDSAQEVIKTVAPPVSEVLSVMTETDIQIPKYETEVATLTAEWDVPLTDEEMTVLLETCEAGHIHPSIVLGLIQVESDFRADALNPTSGCYGYCQLNPRYFPSGLSPADNIRTGIEYLIYQLERYDNLEAALTAYNAGHDTGDRTYANMVIAAAANFGG